MINLRAVVPNPNGDLLPGMFVRARLEEGARPDSVPYFPTLCDARPEGSGLCLCGQA